MAPSMKLVATFQTLPADTPRLCSKVFTAFCYYLSEAALHTYTPTPTHIYTHTRLFMASPRAREKNKPKRADLSR